MHLSIYLSIYLPFFPFIFSYIHPSVYLFIHSLMDSFIHMCWTQCKPYCAAHQDGIMQNLMTDDATCAQTLTPHRTSPSSLGRTCHLDGRNTAQASHKLFRRVGATQSIHADGIARNKLLGDCYVSVLVQLVEQQSHPYTNVSRCQVNRDCGRGHIRGNAPLRDRTFLFDTAACSKQSAR